MCTNIIGTLLDILGGKTRDRLKMQDDLVDLKIRSKLAPQVKGNRIFISPACNTQSCAKKLS